MLYQVGTIDRYSIVEGGRVIVTTTYIGEVQITPWLGAMRALYVDAGRGYCSSCEKPREQEADPVC